MTNTITNSVSIPSVETGNNLSSIILAGDDNPFSKLGLTAGAPIKDQLEYFRQNCQYQPDEEIPIEGNEYSLKMDNIVRIAEKYGSVEKGYNQVNITLEREGIYTIVTKNLNNKIISVAIGKGKIYGQHIGFGEDTPNGIMGQKGDIKHIRDSEGYTEMYWLLTDDELFIKDTQENERKVKKTAPEFQETISDLTEEYQSMIDVVSATFSRTEIYNTKITKIKDYLKKKRLGFEIYDNNGEQGYIYKANLGDLLVQVGGSMKDKELLPIDNFLVNDLNNNSEYVLGDEGADAIIDYTIEKDPRKGKTEHRFFEDGKGRIDFESADKEKGYYEWTDGTERIDVQKEFESYIDQIYSKIFPENKL